MVLLLVDMKQCQMEFGGDYIVMFIEDPLETRFQSSWTGRNPLGTRVEKRIKLPFQCDHL